MHKSAEVQKSRRTEEEFSILIQLLIKNPLYINIT
jgi:hypothetical protein